MRTMQAVIATLILTLGATSALAQESRAERIERARTLFVEGSAAYDAGRLREALQKMKAAHAVYRRPEFAFNIARVLERMGEAEHAISWFRVYLAHGRPSAEERADVDTRIAALEELQSRQASQLIARAPTTEELSQESREFFENGVAMYERGAYEAAMQAFEYVQQLGRFPELDYNMALTAERLARYRDAADHYREYLRSRRDAAERARIEAHIRELQERHAQQRRNR
jgi:tetratricopeptide (TPR) repeat protein